MESSDNKTFASAGANSERWRFRILSTEVLIVMMVTLLFLLYFGRRFIVVVPAGHKGVYFSVLAGGTQTSTYYDEGLKFKLPWDDVYLYNTRVQEHVDTIVVLTEGGLEVETEISFRYLPDFKNLGRLHREVGPNYLHTILVPRVSAIVRDVISRYDINSLYSTSRDSIQKDITRRGQLQVTDNYPIILVNVVIKSIDLPRAVAEAINDKLVYEQQMLEYEYRLLLEEKEATRKLIEARGIKAFVDSSGEDILKWEGIKATQELATSENAKIIVIGTDSNDLPVILGGSN
ncbi:MAG: prohibitin family protein [Bacteroidota bacterium]